MKTAKDPRHIRRRKTVKALYAAGYQPDRAVADSIAKKILLAKDQIDPIIEKTAPEWAINKINRVDLAILRLAIWECMIEGKVPPKVIIDEAVELAKKYGAEGSPGFVNGVLGTVLAKKKPKAKKN